MRKTIVVATTAALLLAFASPALGVYTRFKYVRDRHVENEDGRKRLEWAGQLVLNQARNPEQLPPGGERCPFQRTVLIRKLTDDGWKVVSRTTTDAQGDFVDRLPHRHREYSFVAPKAESGQAECFKAHSAEYEDYEHSHQRQ